MRTDEAFEAMLAQVSRMHFPKTYQERAQRWLKYFYRQSLCDLDRRDSPHNIQKNFKMFEEELRGYNIISELEKMTAWKVAARFAAKPTERINPFESRSDLFDSVQKEFKLVPLHDSWTVDKLLMDVREKMAGVNSEEDLSAVIALDLLITESKKAAFARDKSLIRKNWEAAKPALVKYKVFDDFKGSRALRHRLSFFLFGKI